MRNLGYTKFVAQGGDWGNAVTEIMALQAPPELLAVSSNMPATVPPEIDAALFAGKPKPDGLTADESRAWDQIAFFYKNGNRLRQRDESAPANPLRNRRFTDRAGSVDSGSR